MFANVLSEIFDQGAEKRYNDAEDEREAILAAQDGEERAVIGLMYAYASALRGAVKWASGITSELEDLRASAVAGLLEAIAAFDWNSGHERLAALAPAYIRNAVSTHAQTAVGFSVPERTLKRFFGILRKAEGNVYAAAALAPEFAMSRETFFSVLSAVRNVDSYEAATSAGDSGEPAREPEASSIWADPDADDDALLVEVALDSVDDLERSVVRRAYGFDTYGDPVSDAEVAFEFGLSRQKAQRTRAAALGKMRDALAVS